TRNDCNTHADSVRTSRSSTQARITFRGRRHAFAIAEASHRTVLAIKPLLAFATAAWATLRSKCATACDLVAAITFRWDDRLTTRRRVGTKANRIARQPRATRVVSTALF